MASSAMDQPLGHEHRPAPRRLRAWLRKLTGAWAGADSRRRRAWLALGRMFKLVVLLALIVVALTSTTVLDRPSQVFLLKAFLVCFLSLLPGWLYLQFIAVKGTGLYDEYVLNLYRLRIDDVANLPKPPPGSRYWAWWKEAVAPDLDPARNIYLKKFEAVYGRSAVPQSRRQHDLDDDDTAGTTARLFERIHADAFSPVIMATALLCVGWIIVVEPEPFRGVRLLGGLALTGLPRMPDQALRFGFIGSYAFIMQSLVRRYFQADLKTHAYLSAIARVILVAALITAIHPLWSTCCASRARRRRGGSRCGSSTARTSGCRRGSSRKASRTCRTWPRPTWSTSCSRPAHRSTGCSTGSTRRSCTCGCATATTATGTATTTRTAPAGCCAATGSGRRRTCSARSTTPTAWTPGSARRSCAC